MHVYKPYHKPRFLLADPNVEILHVDLAMPGVEVVTQRNEDGKLVSVINAPGMRLDGQTLPSYNLSDDSKEHHEKALRLARIAKRY